MSYLDAKFNLMNMYCSNLAFYVLLKAQGVSIKNHPVIRRLIYIKTLMGKLKPLDKKLEYQINKLLRLASEEVLVGKSYSKRAETEDPLALKPRPEAMSRTLTTQDIEIDDEGQVVESRSKKQNLYVAPKIRATEMEEDAKEKRKSRDEERRKARMYKSNFVEALKGNYDEAPEEIKGNYNPVEEMDEEDKERQRYEEDNFLRLPVTKKDKKKRKEKEKKIAKGEDFDDFSEIDKIKGYFKEQERIKLMKEDEKDNLLQKTLADFLTKRKNEKLEEGEDEIYDDFQDEGGFNGRRKKVKQDQGNFQAKKMPRGSSKGAVPTKRIHSKFEKGGQQGNRGFSKGKMGKKRF